MCTNSLGVTLEMMGAYADLVAKGATTKTVKQFFSSGNVAPYYSSQVYPGSYTPVDFTCPTTQVIMGMLYIGNPVDSAAPALGRLFDYQNSFGSSPIIYDQFQVFGDQWGVWTGISPQVFAYGTLIRLTSALSTANPILHLYGAVFTL